ncbi:MAG: fasciclin domain-containing protein [Anaerolineae bacterium]|nr:fasciclin domain-containing protein [Anaerolineae bacterium]
MKRNVLLTLITVVLALAAPAFAGPSDRTTISDIAESNGDFIILWAALQTSGLDSVLDDKGQYTVFAPTDAAFAAALSELNITADQLLASEDLTNILLYHVVRGNRDSSAVIGSDQLRPHSAHETSKI